MESQKGQDAKLDEIRNMKDKMSIFSYRTGKSRNIKDSIEGLKCLEGSMK